MFSHFPASSYTYNLLDFIYILGRILGKYKVMVKVLV